MVRFPPLKLTHKIALLIFIPLLLELSFLVLLQGALDQAEKDRKAESEAVDVSMKVNQIMSNLLFTGGSLLMVTEGKNNTYLLEFQHYQASLMQYTHELEEMADVMEHERGNIKSFVSLLDELQNTFEEVGLSQAQGPKLDRARLFPRVEDYIARTSRAGLKVVEQQRLRHQELKTKQVADRERLKLIIELSAVANVLTVALLTAVFLLRFGIRFRHLMDNTIKIAMEQPPGTVVSGKDELAQLDRVLHNLAEEIEQRRRAERALIDNTADVICSLDEQLKLADINPAVYKKLGWEPQELMGQHMQSLIHPEDRNETYRQLETCTGAQEPVTFEARMKHKEGHDVPMEWSASWSSEDRSLFCILHDISERKEAEKLKQEVMAMVSHDLRAPLTSLSVILDMQLQGVFGVLSERGQKMTGVARESVSALISMINDLLDVERYESGHLKLHMESTTAASMVERAVSYLEGETQRREVRLHTESTEIAMKADTDRLVRVLSNLIGNAIKFSPRDSVVEISHRMTIGPDREKAVLFSISDQGPGIPEQELPFVFDKFRQVGTGSEGEKVGSGLGLTICKAIVEAHGGEIGVHSVLGRGTTFWFRIPRGDLEESESG